MATYLGTHGSKIQNYTTDPDNPNTGEVWYNETANTLKFQYGNVTSAGSWASSPALNTGRVELAGAGTSTAALMFGGDASPISALTELFNGTSYSEVNDLNMARATLGAAGATNTAALAFGGYDGTPGYQNETETWNGTNWTEVNNLTQARAQLAGCGTNTAAIGFGGRKDSGATEEEFAGTESWNGTNWTEVNDLNTARQLLAGSGTNTSALAYGGVDYHPSTVYETKTESWNGTNWTEVADLNAARYNWQGIGDSNTSALAVAGYTGTANSGLVELWNGTAWTETTNVSDDGNAYGSAGTATSALISGGNGRSPNASSEKWQGAGVSIGAWSAGGNMNTARQMGAYSGIQTAALGYGGNNGPANLTLTEQYNGTNWTEVNDLNTARETANNDFTGTYTACLFGGGLVAPATGGTESCNGTN